MGKNDYAARSNAAEARRHYWEVTKYTEVGTPENDEAFECRREIEARFEWEAPYTPHHGSGEPIDHGRHPRKQTYKRSDGSSVTRRHPYAGKPNKGWAWREATRRRKS